MRQFHLRLGRCIAIAVAVAFAQSAAADIAAADAAFRSGDFAKALAEYRAVAEDSSSDALVRGLAQERMAFLFQLQWHGQDISQAALWAERSYQSGHPDGMTRWGSFLLNGWGGVSKNEKAAAHVFGQAAALGDATAKRELADLYFRGAGVEKNAKRGLSLLLEAIDAGDTNAMLEAAKRYLVGNGAPLDITKARVLFERAGEAGNPFAYRNIGAMYASGYGAADGKPDVIKAIIYLKKAVEQPFDSDDRAFAANKLGETYWYGDGVPRDQKEACSWFQKGASEEGFEAAWSQMAIGRCYLFGSGVAKDEKLAAEWLKKAAAANVSVAQRLLGIMYSDGIGGLPKDDSAAANLWQKAADQKDAMSQYFLGTLYEDGLGVARNYGQAAALYRAAAEQNEANAQNKLGAKYAEGKGVNKDMIEALKWFNIASANGHAKAIENRESAERLMKPAEIQKAQRLASDWMKAQRK